MYYHVLQICAILTVCTARAPGPQWPPTKGEIWPKPQHEIKQSTYYTFDPALFSIKVKDNKTCDILTQAIQRYSYAFDSFNNIINRGETKTRTKRLETVYMVADSHSSLGVIRQLEIDLKGPCEDYPYFGMDESYNLTVSENSELRCVSIWGALRGLESFSQLFHFNDNYDEIRVNSTEIVDYPQYVHRGLLIDTSRHYIAMRNILRTLDAMEMNKMNVLHWHIVDDESFPYQSDKFPELSNRGAFHPSMIYTKNNVKEVIEYARVRGIRVLPEFDMPGHTQSWGLAYPQILTQCYEDGKFSGLGPMNPIYNATYKIIRELFQEIQEVFPDKYIHIGGDEVEMDCWATNPELLEYMKDNNLTSINQLHALFMERAIPLLGGKSKPIVWQEVYDEGVHLSGDTLVQVWKWNWIEEMKRILSGGHQVLFSSSWYLDTLSSGGDWLDFYKSDPRDMVQNATLAKDIVGGEACMWGEVVDDANIISRTWPRTSAVSERLWSPPLGDRFYETLNLARHRLEEHTCRMIRRGIHAQPPNGPGFCFT